MVSYLLIEQVVTPREQLQIRFPANIEMIVGINRYKSVAISSKLSLRNIILVVYSRYV